MRSLLFLAVVGSALGIGLNRLADISVAWDQKREAVVASARASGAEAFVPASSAAGHRRIHVLPGEQEFPTGARQVELARERTRRLLAGEDVGGLDRHVRQGTARN